MVGKSFLATWFLVDIVVAGKLTHNSRCHGIRYWLPFTFRRLFNVKSGLSGIARIIAAAGNSFQGIRDAWKFESAFRQDVVLSTLLLLLSFWLAQTLTDWLLLIMPLFLLLIVEILNSAIENTVDRIGEEHHVFSGRAKDMASAAVMFCLILIAVVWLGMAWSRFYA
jgi:diacylglycerol kinase (ATP)